MQNKNKNWNPEHWVLLEIIKFKTFVRHHLEFITKKNTPLTNVPNNFIMTTTSNNFKLKSKL